MAAAGLAQLMPLRLQQLLQLLYDLAVPLHLCRHVSITHHTICRTCRATSRPPELGLGCADSQGGHSTHQSLRNRCKHVASPVHVDSPLDVGPAIHFVLLCMLCMCDSAPKCGNQLWHDLYVTN